MKREILVEVLTKRKTVTVNDKLILPYSLSEVGPAPDTGRGQGSFRKGRRGLVSAAQPCLSRGPDRLTGDSANVGTPS